MSLILTLLLTGAVHAQCPEPVEPAENLQPLITATEVRKAALDLTADATDALVDFEDIVPGIPGVLLEVVDRPIVRFTLGLVTPDPERRLRRQARKERRKAQRDARQRE